MTGRNLGDLRLVEAKTVEHANLAGQALDAQTVTAVRRQIDLDGVVI